MRTLDARGTRCRCGALVPATFCTSCGTPRAAAVVVADHAVRFDGPTGTVVRSRPILTAAALSPPTPVPPSFFAFERTEIRVSRRGPGVLPPLARVVLALGCVAVVVVSGYCFATVDVLDTLRHDPVDFWLWTLTALLGTFALVRVLTVHRTARATATALAGALSVAAVAGLVRRGLLLDGRPGSADGDAVAMIVALAAAVVLAAASVLVGRRR